MTESEKAIRGTRHSVLLDLRPSVCLLFVASYFLFPLGGCSHAATPKEDSATAAQDQVAAAGSPNPLRPEGAAAKPGAQGPAATAKPEAGGPAVAAKPAAKVPREPFNPIEVNGEFFKDWPAPKLALVITGRQDGYLEPCGCAGMDRMKGGMARRYTFLEDLRKTRNWPVAAVDVGGNIKGFGRQTELKFQTVADAMKKMSYDAIGLGKGELKLPVPEVIAEIAAVNGQESLFVSADVTLYGTNATKRIIQRGGMKIGITSILGRSIRRRSTTPTSK